MKKPIFFEFLVYILVCIISIILVILFWKENILLTTTLIFLLFLITIKLWHKKNDILTIVFGVIFGWASESVCVYFGVWEYTNPTFLVPLWLPILWGIAALIIRRFTFFIERR